MALYQPRVELTWKYLMNTAAGNPNLKIVWTVDVQLSAGELLTFTKASLRDTVIVLSTGGTKSGNFTEEWFAPFNVPYGLTENDEHKDIIRGEIQVNGPIKITTTVKKNGKIEGESVNNTTQNSNISWV